MEGDSGRAGIVGPVPRDACPWVCRHGLDTSQPTGELAQRRNFPPKSQASSQVISESRAPAPILLGPIPPSIRAASGGEAGMWGSVPSLCTSGDRWP